MQEYFETKEICLQTPRTGLWVCLNLVIVLYIFKHYITLDQIFPKKINQIFIRN